MTIMNSITKFICLIVLLPLIVFVSCNTNGKQPKKSVWDYVPHEINGWTAVDSVEVYDRDNIFDYLDGGAEVYLQQGLTALSVIQFDNSKRENITVELYEMAEEKGAYGIFSTLHENVQPGIGEQYEYQAGSLCFWQDNMYVCIVANSGEDSYKETILQLAKYISGKMSQSE